MKRIGRTIRSLREQLGMTQEVLSSQADISNNALQRLESGAGNPTVLTIDKILRVLERELGGPDKYPIVLDVLNPRERYEGQIQDGYISRSTPVPTLSDSARVILAYEMAPQHVRQVVQSALSGVDVDAALSRISQFLPKSEQEES